MPHPTLSPNSYSIRIPRAQFTSFLVLVVLVLLINHVMLQFFYYRLDAGHWVLRDMFDLDEEENLPTYYSSFALLVSAGLLATITLKKYQELDRFARHWFGLAAGFLAMSVDEVAGLHEALNTVMDIPWTAPAAVAIVIMALLYVRFLLHLPSRTRNGFFLAGMMFVGGAIVVEEATDWYLQSHSMHSLGYSLLVALEEGLEMFGIVLFINSLLEYMSPANVTVVQLEAE